jgi:hypothetical protein
MAPMNDAVEHEANRPGVQEDVLTRILMHGMHEETMFYNRINFFILIEALLFTSLLTAGGLKRENVTIAATCGVVGILVTVIWLIVQHDKFRMFKAVSKRLEEDVPDFAQTLRVLKEMYPRGEIHATKLLAWFPAAICGLAWLGLLFYASVRMLCPCSA